MRSRLRLAFLAFSAVLCLLTGTEALGMYDPGTGRFLQRDPIGYPDGMNTYGAYHVLRGGVDPSGLACCCIVEPEKCYIEIDLKGFIAPQGIVQRNPDGSVFSAELFASMSVDVTLRHTEGDDLSDCSLRQDTQGMANFDFRLGFFLNTPGRPSQTDLRFENGITTWETEQDYSAAEQDWWKDRGGGLLNWRGTSYSDIPETRYPASGDPDTVLAVWWEAHVYVEQAPAVETFWGYAASSDFRDINIPVTGSTYWAGDSRDPFSVRPGYHKAVVLGVLN